MRLVGVRNTAVIGMLTASVGIELVKLGGKSGLVNTDSWPLLG